MSDIDPTVFRDNQIVAKADLRQQFITAKEEIEALQEISGRVHIDVRDYGAVINGVVDDTNVLLSGTDDRQAIQDAMDEAATNTYGGTVYIPPGVAVIGSLTSANSCLVVPSNVHVVGAGRESTVLYLRDATLGRIFRCYDIYNFSIRSMKLYGNRANNAGGYHCISAYEIDRFAFEDLWIEESPAYGIGCQGGAITEGYIRRIYIKNSGSDGIDLKNVENANKSLYISDITVEGYDLRGEGGKAAVDIRGHVICDRVFLIGTHPATGQGVRSRQGEELDGETIFNSQTLGSAGDFAIDGDLATAGVATLDDPSEIAFVSSGDDTGITVVVTGTDEVGAPQVSAALALTNGNIAYTTGEYWSTVTQITASGATDGDVYCAPGDHNGLGGSYSTISNVVAIHDDPDDRQGAAVTVAGHNTTVSNVVGRNVGWAVKTASTSYLNTISNVTAENCDYGAAIEGENNSFSNIVATECDYGYRLEDGESNTLNNALSQSAVIAGFSQDTGTTSNNRIINSKSDGDTLAWQGYGTGTQWGPGNINLPNNPQLHVLAVDYVIVRTDSGKTYINTGATAIVLVDLPDEPNIGDNYTFIVTDADGFRPRKSGATDIIDAGVTGTQMSSTVIGSTLTLTAISVIQWAVTKKTGTWILA